MTEKPKTLFFVVNTPRFFISHRLQLALAAKKEGLNVSIVTADGPEVAEIKSYGFEHHLIPFSRSGYLPIFEISTFVLIVRLFYRYKPDLIHLVTIKPLIYGGIAARIIGIKNIIFAVSGLGTVFISQSILSFIRKYLVVKLYRLAFNCVNSVTIFQNEDDRILFIENKIIDSNKSIIISGSGVDLNTFSYEKESSGVPIIVMASRLLIDKGVVEFVEASKILKKRNILVEMRLIGSIDEGNPTSISHNQLQSWATSNHVKILGFKNDIAKQYAAANIVCLPSYREGLPKSLIEAAACGRAIVTTDVPGCRSAIVPNKTGLLVPVRDPVSLADALQFLVENPSIRQEYGEEGRNLAENKFSIEKVVSAHLRLYRDVLEL